MQIFNPKCVFSATNWVASVRLRRHIMETSFLQWKMWLIITYINRKISLSMIATTMTWASSPTKKLLLWKKRLTKSYTLNHLCSCPQRKCFLANAYFYHLLVLVLYIHTIKASTTWYPYLLKNTILFPWKWRLNEDIDCHRKFWDCLTNQRLIVRESFGIVTINSNSNLNYDFYVSSPL